MLGGFYFFKKKKIHYLSELMHIKIIGLQFKAKERNVLQRFPYQLMTNSSDKFPPHHKGNFILVFTMHSLTKASVFFHLVIQLKFSALFSFFCLFFLLVVLCSNIILSRFVYINKNLYCIKLFAL